LDFLHVAIAAERKLDFPVNGSGHDVDSSVARLGTGSR
jgi:hypothetical protein